MPLCVYVLSVQQLSAQKKKKSTTLPKECDAVNVREKALLVVSSAVQNLWWLALVARDTSHGIHSTGFSLDVEKNLTIPEGTVR